MYKRKTKTRGHTKPQRKWFPAIFLFISKECKHSFSTQKPSVIIFVFRGIWWRHNFFLFLYKTVSYGEIFSVSQFFFFSVWLVSASEPFFFLFHFHFPAILFFFDGIFPLFIMLPFDNKKVSPVSWIFIGSSFRR